MKIIGRIREKKLLQSYYEENRPEFLAIYGRRRCGKTFLVKEFFEDNFRFYCTGLAGGDAGLQLKAFNTALNKYGNGAYPYKDNWFDAFSQLIGLIEHSEPGVKNVIFLDEMPWMDTHRSGFLTGLEYFWNSFASSRPDVLLIVCGSATSWIVNRLFRNTGGLYNRVTKQMYIKPFTLHECEQFFRDREIEINRYEMLESYMVFGGIPFYLDYFEKGAGLVQNIDRLCFGESAPLKGEYHSLYETLFARPENHYAVVKALAGKKAGMTRAELLTSTDIANGGRFSKVLTELEQSGFIRKVHSFGRKTQESDYMLSDPFTLFHHRFIKKGGLSDTHFWSHNITDPSHRAWSGLAFEQVCFAHIGQVKAALGIASVQTDVSSWRSRESDPGAQIDMVIDRKDQVVNLCEAKYSMREYTVTKNDELNLRNKAAAFAEETGTRKALHTTLITTYGIKRNEHSGIIQSEVTMDDLFKE